MRVSARRQILISNEIISLQDLCQGEVLSRNGLAFAISINREAICIAQFATFLSKKTMPTTVGLQSIAARAAQIILAAHAIAKASEPRLKNYFKEMPRTTPWIGSNLKISYLAASVELLHKFQSSRQQRALLDEFAIGVRLLHKE